MSDKTNISYADHTWSPWLGCEPVSPGCAHCYASAISKRAGRGPYRHGIERVLTKDWKKPARWNRNGGGRVLVSMCDPFDEEVTREWRVKFWDLIADTPNLTWLLLTKRPENTPWKEVPFRNAWLGVSVENQETADRRIPILLGIRAKVRWISYEPMLGPVDLGKCFPCGYYCDERVGHVDHPFWSRVKTGIDWIVAGGESGPKHRPMDVAWMRSVAALCKLAGVSFYCKQDSHRLPGQQGRIPDDMWKIKEFPQP